MKFKCIAALFFGVVAVSAVNGQETIENAIKKSARYLTGELDSNAKIAVLNIQSDSSVISGYIIDELNLEFVKGKKLTVIERQSIDLLDKETDYQMSGAVKDEEMQSIGKQLGAELIITGSFTVLGKNYRLSLRVIDVTSAKVVAMHSEMIRPTKTITTFITGAQPVKKRAARQRRPPGEWNTKIWYIGAQAGFTQHWYEINQDFDWTTDPYNGFTAAVQTRVHFSSLAVGLEAVFSQDTVKANEPDVSLSTTTIQIPLLARLMYRGAKGGIGIFAGPYYTLSMGDMTVSANNKTKHYEYQSAFGGLAGIVFGFKAGPGFLFVDGRAGLDFGFVRADGVDQYHRNLWSISMGYEIGLFDK
ncbi:MAG: outer membrane beta-barrel protein [Spirochaetaceae bacterium]|jgi:TolB-like protein|nr:outer membrane beta-barrel protein [Spirochaetaceae bacterium]